MKYIYFKVDNDALTIEYIIYNERVLVLVLLDLNKMLPRKLESLKY